MKRLFLALMAVAAIALTGCKDRIDEPSSPSQTDGTKITALRSYTEKSPNPIGDVNNLKLAKSEETLKSLRHVSKKRLFYMDYLADFPMDQLWKTGGQRYTYDKELKGELKYLNDYLDILYKEHPEPKPMDDPLTACSSFICHNEKNELLFCHNMDGAGGSIIAVYQKPMAGKYGFVALSNTIYNCIRFAPEFVETGRLMDGTSDLSILLTQHMAHLGGMNDQGLCYCMLQLPPLASTEMSDPNHTMPELTNEDKKGEGALPQLVNSSMYYMLLTQCATVKDVETALRTKYDYTQLNHIMNGHFLIADATGDFAVFEYWGDTLYVMRSQDRQKILPLTPHVIPYEFNCMENYYCNPKATATYITDPWQFGFSAKVRAGQMMRAYKPIMSEFQALKCLQEGTYTMEYPDNKTNYSAVYNLAKRTVLFNVHNDMSEAFTIDLNKDLNEIGDYGTPQPPKPQGRDTIPY